jgi:hypothetical protein
VFKRLPLYEGTAYILLKKRMYTDSERNHLPLTNLGGEDYQRMIKDAQDGKTDEFVFLMFCFPSLIKYSIGLALPWNEACVTNC